ncbi:hypothetical protein GYA49_04785 [Candidatus Beckwithbacteria bacterium]|nr:hypothetical protein [Candidatus Beckwithbacteria bacterium]
MIFWQSIFIIAYSLFALSGFCLGLRQSSKKHNAFGNHPIFNLIGAFVWGDCVVFGLFWFLVGIVVLLLQNWWLFWLAQSAFWFVRSFGETIYWLNQQYSQRMRNPPQKFWLFKIFKNESVWFINQIAWQCLAVVSLILTIYFTNLWLQSL